MKARLAQMEAEASKLREQQVMSCKHERRSQYLPTVIFVRCSFRWPGVVLACFAQQHLMHLYGCNFCASKVHRLPLCINPAPTC